MIFLVVALADSKMLANNIVLQNCTFYRLTGKPNVYVQNRIPSICALTTCQKMLRSYSTLSGLALMTQDSSREGRGLHRDSLKSSHMARAWSQILQLVCDYSNACKLHKLANMHFPEALLRVPSACLSHAGSLWLSNRKVSEPVRSDTIQTECIQRRPTKGIQQSFSHANEFHM